jgi:hypothetical protein
MTNAPTTSKNQQPAWFWLLISLCGVTSILFAAFCLIVDDISGGPNEGSVVFWIFEGFFALVGLFFMVFGLAFLVKADSDKSPARFWLWVTYCGVLSVIFALICFSVYGMNHGNMGFNWGGIMFWMFESLFALFGIFLITSGLNRFEKTADGGNKS